MQDFVTEFQIHMGKHGFTPRGGKVLADGKWHQAAYDGDSRGNYSGTYIVNITPDGRFANGNCFTRKDPDVKYKWHSKSDEKISPDERKRQRQLMERQQKDKEQAEGRRQEKIALRLRRAFNRLPFASATHPYLARKGVGRHNLRWREKGDELVMPLRDAGGSLWTIQRITPEGGKYLFTGGRKRGSSYMFIGDDMLIILLCEGYATGASIFEATGLTTVAAIDSGNLKEVLKGLKAEYPGTKFIICGDNDAFTVNAKKEAWNVGKEKAEAAAADAGGAYVVLPDFGSVDPAEYSKRKPTDFNDLHSLSGMDAVRSQIMAVVEKIPVSAPVTADAPAMAETPVSDQHHSGGENFTPEYGAEPPAAGVAVAGDFGMNFKVLGYNEGTYYYFPFKERQIVALSASAHTLPNLFRLDDLESWQTKFGGTDVSEKKIVLYATNALMGLAKARGVFKEEDSVRGCGAWLDEGRKVLHCGDVLYIDGAEKKFDQIQSEFTYVASSKLLRPAADPLTDKEAYGLRQICEAVTWDNKLSGSLLAGWLVIAPVCGALPFRPHIWITGEAESGKSTVMDRIIKPVLGRISVNVDGKTSEPKIREIIGYGARPVVFDEAEKSVSIEDVLSLARLSSTGGTVGKYGQKIFKARSAFCFSAVNPPVNKTTDESRISFMTIRKNRRETAIKEYNDLLDAIDRIITPDYSSRMISRTLRHIDALFKNIHTFQKAARVIIKGARASQVVGTMLAGLYLLSRTDIVTQEFAEEWIAKHDWTNHALIEDKADPSRLLQYISSCILRYSNSGMSKDMSIGDLIYLVHKDGDSAAKKLLRYNGIDVSAGRVYFSSTSHHLGKMLRDTEWSIKWTPMLENILGAEKFKIHYFGVGDKTSGVSLPMSAFTDDEPQQQPELEPLQDSQEIPF